MHGNMTRITNIQSDLNSDVWSASNYCIIGRELTNFFLMRCCHSVNVITICRSQRLHVKRVSLLEQCVRYVVLLQLGQCKLSGKSRQHSHIQCVSCSSPRRPLQPWGPSKGYSKAVSPEMSARAMSDNK